MAQRAATFFATAALALGFSAAGQAACPRLIMVSGKLLDEPIVISDWDTACRLYGSFFSSPPADATDLTGRRSVRLGLFWNSLVWEPYVRDNRLGELNPVQANQVGRFYPSVGDKPALVDVPGYGEWPKLVNEVVLRILEEQGVATRLGDGDEREIPWLTIGVIGVAVLTISLLLVAVRSRRDRRSHSPPLVET